MLSQIRGFMEVNLVITIHFWMVAAVRGALNHRITQLRTLVKNDFAENE